MPKMNERLHFIREVRKIVTLVLVLTAIVGLCFGVGFLAGERQNGSVPELSAIVVQNQLEQVSQLATTQYNYTNMGQFSQSSNFHGIKIPFSGKHFIVSYDGVILAGVDLKKSEIKILGNTVTVTLPEAEILSHEINEDSLKVFDETKNIFNPITLENYNSFYREEKGKVENKAVEGGLMVQAEEQAQLVVKQTLGPVAEQNEMNLEIKVSI
ncbi:MAG: DUF4230 domain-containing protein [Firmicutes bacterium]|nr:DUF4230 domain-containing protein [Bacillota bacterium]